MRKTANDRRRGGPPCPPGDGADHTAGAVMPLVGSARLLLLQTAEELSEALAASLGHNVAVEDLVNRALDCARDSSWSPLDYVRAWAEEIRQKQHLPLALTDLVVR